MKRFYVLAICILFLLSIRIYPQIVINEFMASNSNSITDPDHNEHGDWIELYNKSNSPINLNGYSITDSKSSPRKYVFNSDIIIESNGYLLIWADDYNTGIHTNFKLSASGEYIGLFNSNSQVIDSLTFPLQQTDISYGCYPNGEKIYFFFDPSTPNSENLETSIFNRLSPPEFSLESGFYSGMPLLNLSSTVSDTKIYYTLDGTTPNINSTQFTNTLHLASTLVVKALAVKDGFANSKVVTKTYFINEDSELPIISLSTNPDNFFGDTSGIYVIGTNGIVGHCSNEPRNWNQDWERPITIEYFDKDNERKFCVDAGVKIYGGCTRLYPQKSLGFYFRDEYGYKKLNYRLFENRNITEYNNFILRSSGQDWWRTMFRDGFVQTLVMQNSEVDAIAYKPAVVFFNGDYWGIHNIREKLNEHYVEEHFQITEDNVDLIEYSKGITANVGDITAYNQLQNFLNQNNFTQDAPFNHLSNVVDIDEYSDYLIFQIYGANADWPGSNTKLWHARDNSVKWRFMIYDTDFTFGGNSNGQYNSNTLELATSATSTTYPNPAWSTLLFRKLLDNAKFKNGFIQKFAARINNTFAPGYVISIIDSMKAVIASEIPKHKLRWEQSVSFTTGWDNNVEIMRNFARKRPSYMFQCINEHFSLTGTYKLSISKNNNNFGKIYIQNILVRDTANQTYFKNIPLTIRAEANPGYHFVCWSGVSNSSDREITLTLNNNSNLNAVFEKDQQIANNIIINEINYKSYDLFDTGDWIEFYNNTDNNISLAGYYISDLSNNKFFFSNTDKIDANSYLVACQDTTKFKLLHPNISNFIGNMGFGLGSDEERISIHDNNDNLIDEIQYDSTWGLSTYFVGKTLSLKNPQLDNSISNSWSLSKSYGTPGKINDIYTKIEDELNVVPESFTLFQNYPNPFNPETTIRYSLSETDNVTLEIFNTIGQKIMNKELGNKAAGTYEIKVNMNGYSSGVYFYSIKSSSNNGSIFKKMVLIK